MKNAIITGASSDIGKAVTIILAKSGFKVFLLARNLSKLKEIKNELSATGADCEVVKVDLTSTNEINAAVNLITSKVECIDLIANIAGIWHSEREVFANKDLETFDQKVIVDTFWVGTIAPTLICASLLPLMKNGGNIINLSGTFESGAKGWVPYYVSKRAIEDLTIALSQELFDRKIQVNCISPSDTATEAYEKFFPQYMDSAITTNQIADQIQTIINSKKFISGKVFILRKGSAIEDKFHA